MTDDVPTLDRRSYLKGAGATISTCFAGCNSAPWIDYYVDPDGGRNTNSGETPEAAFADLKPFESQVSLEPGARIRLMGGVQSYGEELNLSGMTGTEADPIRFERAPGEEPVLDFTASNGHGLLLDYSQFVSVRGVEIRNADKHNVRILGNRAGNSGPQNARNVTIIDCEIHGHGAGRSFGHGILSAFGADRTTIRGCEIYDGRSGGNSDGIHASNMARSTVIEWTVCHHNSDDGIDFGAGAAHDPTFPARLRRVVCYRNGTDLSGNASGDGSGFKTGNCDNPAGGDTFVRCVAFDNDARGIGGPCTDVPLRIHNCTSVNNRIVNIHAASNTEHEVLNCLSSGANKWDLILSPDATVRNCNWDESLNGKFDATNGNGFEVDFRSTDPDSNQFLRLPDGSPAIDAGTDTDVEFTGPAPDMGAYEFDAEVPDVDYGPPSLKEQAAAYDTNGESCIQPSEAQRAIDKYNRKEEIREVVMLVLAALNS